MGLKIGYAYDDGDGHWLRIEDTGTGDVWDEPLSDYNDIVPTEAGGERYFLNKRTGEKVWPE